MIKGYFQFIKIIITKEKKGLTYYKLFNNIKYILNKIPIYIYKNLIKKSICDDEKYPSKRKRKSKKISELNRRFKCSKM